jgi:glycolate dehydrogenase FAD-binding subunit
MRAEQESEVVDAVRWAHDKRTPLEIVANGTKRAFGNTILGEPLDVSGLAGIISYEPEELIVTARPGTTLSELRAVLSEKKQQLGFDPPEWAPFFGTSGNSTLGGILSVDAAGPARVRYGGARDHLLGVRAVNGFGAGFRAGGRVVKNVTGFDVPKLVCGSFGTLCILTEVTLRVFPKPALSATLAVRSVSAREGLALLRRVWTSPLESSGLSYLPDRISPTTASTTGTALIRFDGAQEPLAEKLALARPLLQGMETDTHDGDEHFAPVADGSLFRDLSFDVWRVYVPPAWALPFLDEAAPAGWMADWAGGLLWVGLEAGDAAARTRLARAAARTGAQAIRMRGDPKTCDRSGIAEPEDAGLHPVLSAVKRAFDPLVLLNRDRLYDDEVHDA